MKVDDLKVKVVLDDAQAQAALAELLRGAAALEQLLLGMGQALSSPAGQAVVVDALVRRIEELKDERDELRGDLDALRSSRRPDAPTRAVTVCLTEQEIHTLELGGELVVVAAPFRRANEAGER